MGCLFFFHLYKQPVFFEWSSTFLYFLSLTFLLLFFHKRKENVMKLFKKKKKSHRLPIYIQRAYYHIQRAYYRNKKRKRERHTLKKKARRKEHLDKKVNLLKILFLSLLFSKR